MTDTVSVRAASEADLDIAVAWLTDERLPVDDLTADHLALTATRDGKPVAVIGLEAFGDVGLLRSLVVSRSERGSGVGQRLVSELEAHAASLGIRELWLLTIDADAFFAARGYSATERDLAPPAIRQTREFAGLCPGDAVLMRKPVAA